VELEQLGINLSFENIIVGAFKLFPDKFSLSGWSEYPDATRMEKCLWRSGKKRQWIAGKKRLGYLVTERTRAIAKQTKAQLSGPASGKHKPLADQRRKTSILREVETASAYLKYTNGKGETISEAEFCYLLQGTLDSSKQTLKENLASLKMFAGELEREDVLKFLDWLEQHFNEFLKKSDKY
jgi:hypothetical protein